MHYLKARLTKSLIEYFEQDYRRIEHALSVLYHAEVIAETKYNVDYDVVVASALLHDVGIKPAETLHGFNNGPLQEELGPPEAERILDSLGFPKDKTVMVMQIIGNHHSRSRYPYKELEILKQADAIVNRKETEETRRH